MALSGRIRFTCDCSTSRGVRGTQVLTPPLYVVVVGWWSLPSSVRQDEDEKPAHSEARGEFEEVDIDMANLAHVTKRLEGGDSNSNLTHFCKHVGFRPLAQF